MKETSFLFGLLIFKSCLKKIFYFRHHVFEKIDYRNVDLNEVGPRFDLKPYQISLGTLNQPEASKEWVLRPYMNTATKRQAL